MKMNPRKAISSWKKVYRSVLRLSTIFEIGLTLKFIVDMWRLRWLHSRNIIWIEATGQWQQR